MNVNGYEIKPNANLKGANLEGANLKGAYLEGANLIGADLYGAYLEGANLYGANLYGANLYGANLYGANLYDANLQGANLYGANLYDANLQGANLYGANLYGANLKGANLKGANLQGANLYGANLIGANLQGANLKGANLQGANLYGANLKGANLQGANLEGAYLIGADFYGAYLEGANITGTILEKKDDKDQKIQEEIAYKKALKALDKLYDENGDALQQLAAIEREELLEKMNSQAIQTSIAGIDKYSDALKQLAETEKVELRAELEKKKKENFELVATACMKAYEEKYGSDVFPVDEHWVYMVGDYGATGEGSTHCLYLTQALPYGDDFSGENKYVPINSKEYRAVREFHEQFGTFMLYGLRFLSKEDFYTQYAYFIPPVMMNLSNAKCYKSFYTKVHYNFS